MRYREGRRPRARKIVVYGPEGVGKTTLALGMPSPWLVDANHGADEFDVRGSEVDTWMGPDSVMESMEWLAANVQAYGIETVAIDSVTDVELMCQRHICAQERVNSLADIGYGRGFVQARDEFTKLLHAGERIVRAGAHVVLLGHANVSRFSEPGGHEYDRYSLRLDRHTSAKVMEWADLVMFLDVRKEYMQKTGGFNQKKTVAISTGQRVLYTEKRAEWDAKSRIHGLPPELPAYPDSRQTWALIKQWIDYSDSRAGNFDAGPETEDAGEPEGQSLADNEDADGSHVVGQ